MSPNAGAQHTTQLKVHRKRNMMSFGDARPARRKKNATAQTATQSVNHPHYDDARRFYGCTILCNPEEGFGQITTTVLERKNTACYDNNFVFAESMFDVAHCLCFVQQSRAVYA